MQPLLARAEREGLRLAPISRYAMTPPTDPARLVIGYSNFADAAIPTVVALLAAALEAGSEGREGTPQQGS